MSSFYQTCLQGDYSRRRYCRDQCTLDTCPLSLSFWAYRPSLAANSTFLALFALSLGVFICQGVLSRRFLGFTIAMVSGCILEVLGYVGRIMSYYNPFHEARKRPYCHLLGPVCLQSTDTSSLRQTGFLLQIVCLTIAPAFFAAGVYLCLSRIVVTFGVSNSRIKPLSYPRIFIPCDVVSLLLQAVGGGMASAASHQGKNPKVGNDIMIAGLAFQVVTLFVFIVLALDFALRTVKRKRAVGSEEALDQKHAALRASWVFRGFLIALAFSTLCIFTRSVYRVAELSEGWNGHLIKTQKYFIGLEGAIVSAAALALNLFHPGLCFREGYEERAGFGFGRKKQVINVEEKL